MITSGLYCCSAVVSQCQGGDVHLRSGAGHLSEETGALAGLGSGSSLRRRGRVLGRRVRSSRRVTGGRRNRGRRLGRGSRRAARGSSSTLTRHFR